MNIYECDSFAKDIESLSDNQLYELSVYLRDNPEERDCEIKRLIINMELDCRVISGRFVYDC